MQGSRIQLPVGVVIHRSHIATMYRCVSMCELFIRTKNVHKKTFVEDKRFIHGCENSRR